MSFLKADETGDILMSDPVAWMDAYDHTNLYYRKPQQVDVVPLYTHPPAAQPEPPDFSKDGQMGAVNIAIKEYAKNYARAALAAHESYWHKIADERAAEIVRLLEAIEFVLPMWEEEVRGHYSAGARTNGTKALEMMRAAIDSEREKG